MANLTDDDIFVRVEGILKTVAQITTLIVSDDCILTDSDLPAAIVLIRGGLDSRTNEDYWTHTRTVQIGVLFTRLCGDSVDEQREQMRRALRLTRIVPDAFARLDRLALDNRPMDHINQPSEMRSSGLETRPWGASAEVYYASTYEFTVSDQRT